MWDSNTVAYTMHKIAVLWDENVEFSKGTPLSWDEFIAGFTAVERKIYNYFA
jgi:hypothetical protein